MRGNYIKRLNTSKKVLSILTLSDFSTWSSANLTGVIFTLFALEHIKDATITDVGFSSLLFLSVSAILNIPLGRLLDRTRGFLDENYVLVASSVVRGGALILLAFSTQLWQLYLLQAILGVARSMNYVSWRVLFSKFLDPKHVAEQWSVYDSIIAIGLGFAALIGGYLGDNFPYTYVIFIAGVVTIIGGVFPLFIHKEIKETVQ
ncbi:MAG TPA: MFS transporter [Candidatus Dojkabacteria bacterium]|nr:MFS transporter [Candidatus Dojkabacteria bacterium]